MDKKKRTNKVSKLVKPQSEYHKSNSEYLKSDMENGYSSSSLSSSRSSTNSRAKTATHHHGHYIKTGPCNIDKKYSYHDNVDNDILTLKDTGRFPTELEDEDEEEEFGIVTEKVKDKVHWSDDSDDDKDSW